MIGDERGAAVRHAGPIPFALLPLARSPAHARHYCAGHNVFPGELEMRGDSLAGQWYVLRRQRRSHDL